MDNTIVKETTFREVSLKIFDLIFKFGKLPNNRFTINGELEVVVKDEKLIISKLFSDGYDILIVDLVDNYNSCHLFGVSIDSYNYAINKEGVLNIFSLKSKYLSRVEFNDEVNSNLVVLLDRIIKKVDSYFTVEDSDTSSLVSFLDKIISF